jgi:heptaprenyl diphosphate synthase
MTDEVSDKSWFLTTCAILAAVALVLSYLEFLVPLPLPVPGIKLGLANIAVIIAIYLLGGRCGAIVAVLKVLLSGLLFSGVGAMLYSAAGTLLALAAMIPMVRCGRFGTVGVSVGGAAAHVTGQMAVAALAVATPQLLLTYLPILLLTSIPTGALTGYIAHLILNRLPN